MKILPLRFAICIFILSSCQHPADPTTNANKSSAPATSNQNQSAEPTPELSPAPSPEQSKTPGTEFMNFSAFAAKLQKIDSVRLFEGLPHQMFASRLHEEELRTKKTVRLHRFPFYEETLELKEADAAELTLIFRNRKSFRPFSGPKACGGFHPDYGLEWNGGQEIYQALVCFGCHEVMLFGPDVELYCEIGDKAWAVLWKLLEPYHKNRPGPRLH